MPTHAILFRNAEYRVGDDVLVVPRKGGPRQSGTISGFRGIVHADSPAIGVDVDGHGTVWCCIDEVRLV